MNYKSLQLGTHWFPLLTHQNTDIITLNDITCLVFRVYRLCLYESPLSIKVEKRGIQSVFFTIHWTQQIVPSLCFLSASLLLPLCRHGSSYCGDSGPNLRLPLVSSNRNMAAATLSDSSKRAWAESVSQEAGLFFFMRRDITSFFFFLIACVDNDDTLIQWSLTKSICNAFMYWTQTVCFSNLSDLAVMPLDSHRLVLPLTDVL